MSSKVAIYLCRYSRRTDEMLDEERLDSLGVDDARELLGVPEGDIFGDCYELTGEMLRRVEHHLGRRISRDDLDVFLEIHAEPQK